MLILSMQLVMVVLYNIVNKNLTKCCIYFFWHCETLNKKSKSINSVDTVGWRASDLQKFHQSSTKGIRGETSGVYGLTVMSIEKKIGDTEAEREKQMSKLETCRQTANNN